LELLMHPSQIIVDGYVSTEADNTDLREEALAFALDQRAFGPRRLLVAFADPFGKFLALAHTARTEPIELALACCLQSLGQGKAAAVAFCDEPVTQGPPPANLAERFASARALCSEYGVHLVDWFCCDDDLFRSARLALEPGAEWWDVP
jgi:hypothetical protein